MHPTDYDASVDVFDVEEERSRRFFLTRPLGHLIGGMVVFPLAWVWDDPALVWLALAMVGVGALSLPFRRRGGVRVFTGLLLVDVAWVSFVILILGLNPLAASLLFAGHAATAYLTLPGFHARAVTVSIFVALLLVGLVDVTPLDAMTGGRVTTTEVLMALFGLTSVIVDFELIGRAIRQVAQRRRHDLELATEVSEQRAAALRTVSHELRTPLTSIGGFAHFLTDHGLTPEERAEFAHRIVTESTHLNHLVDDLLASASLEAGQLKLRVQPVTVGESARQVAEVFRPRGVDIDIDIDPSHTVSADPARLGQILRNLLSNVEKYGGAVARVSSHRADAHVVLTVSDDGPGVASADRERIFQDFAQVGGASHVTGTGLGLGISRRLAQAMGGDLRCVDAGVGARFELVLPVHV